MTVQPAEPHRWAILIVDDAPEMCELLEAMLDGEPYTLTTVGSGQQALLVVSRGKPDLILLDHMLPDMNGVAVYWTLRAHPRTATIPVLFITAYPNEVRRSVPASELWMLIKPFRRPELLRMVAELLGR